MVRQEKRDLNAKSLICFRDINLKMIKAIPNALEMLRREDKRKWFLHYFFSLPGLLLQMLYNNFHGISLVFRQTVI
ncbi:MAG: hypothetical protein AMK69_07460 [Nitrospira bacterium SG8_3]|nr:MAG: hypothetical protein AMK69_07460 [Nitrospira bacterium SG8_3]